MWQSVLDLHFRLSLGFLKFEHFSIGSWACVCLNWQIADLTWCPIPHFVLQSVQFVLLHFGHGWVALHFRFIFGFVNFFCLKQFFGLTLYFPLKQTIFLVWCPIPQDTSHGFQPRGSHRKTHWSQIVKSTGRFLASQNESGTLFVTEIKYQDPLLQFTIYSGLLKIRTRMCKDFWQKSGFLGKVLFFEKVKVRIFWKIAILKKMLKLVKMLKSPVRKRVNG